MTPHGRRRSRARRDRSLPPAGVAARYRRLDRRGTKHRGSLDLEFFSRRNACTPDALGRGGDKKEKEEVMRNLLMAAATGALLVAAVPASAQVYMGADPGGAGVQVGPFGFGVGPRYGYDRWRGDEYRGDAYYAYGAECPLVKERIVTADGRRIIRTHRSCR